MCIARVIGILVLICISVPIFAACIVPMFFIYLLIREFYRRSSRELQRIESVSRSPLNSHLNETLNGITSVRAFGRGVEWYNLAIKKIEVIHRTKFAAEVRGGLEPKERETDEERKRSWELG